MSEGCEAGQVAAGSPHLVARRGRGGIGGAGRRVRCTGLSIPRGDAGDRLLGISISAGPLPMRPPLTGAPRKLKLSWNAGAICLAPLPVAVEHGIFKKHDLDVELINFGGSTEKLLEAIATGKADAGLGMALRWLKALEQGSTSRSPRVRMAAACACCRGRSGHRQARRPQGQDVGVETSAAPARTSSRSCSPSRASTR